MVGGVGVLMCAVRGGRRGGGVVHLRHGVECYCFAFAFAVDLGRILPLGGEWHGCCTSLLGLRRAGSPRGVLWRGELAQGICSGRISGRSDNLRRSGVSRTSRADRRVLPLDALQCSRTQFWSTNTKVACVHDGIEICWFGD